MRCREHSPEAGRRVRTDSSAERGAQATSTPVVCGTRPPPPGSLCTPPCSHLPRARVPPADGLEDSPRNPESLAGALPGYTGDGPRRQRGHHLTSKPGFKTRTGSSWFKHRTQGPWRPPGRTWQHPARGARAARPGGPPGLCSVCNAGLERVNLPAWASGLSSKRRGQQNYFLGSEKLMMVSRPPQNDSRLFEQSSSMVSRMLTRRKIRKWPNLTFFSLKSA